MSAVVRHRSCRCLQRADGTPLLVGQDGDRDALLGPRRVCECLHGKAHHVKADVAIRRRFLDRPRPSLHAMPRAVGLGLVRVFLSTQITRRCHP